MPPSPALLQLAVRLRQLRQEQWANSKLTQGDLGKALGGDQGLSVATIASWENRTAPKLPQRERMFAYAQFFATPRSVTGAPRLVPLDSFTDEERATYETLLDELLALYDAARGKPIEPIVAGRSWHFTDAGPLTLVCAQLPEDEAVSLADPANPNYTELLSFGDLDAMVELHGHIRAENPAMDVFFKPATKVVADSLSGHVVILGGIAWNEVTQRILELTQLPVTQQDEPGLTSGDIFVTELDGKERRYLPIWSQTEPPKLIQDIGLLVRMPNPLNSNRTLTMCNGIHSRGVLGAVRSLTDKQLRESNERYIARNFPDNQQFGILMRIQVIEGSTMTPDFNITGTVLYQWPTNPSGAEAGR
jgi:transcriptional regulator with XRE-family HTH domain